MNKKKGFSLVELLVAMAIIAVLISIAAYGISILQRNSRNTMRRKEVDNIRMTITEAELNTNLRVGSITLTNNTVNLITTGTNSIGTYQVSTTFAPALILNTCVFSPTNALHEESSTGALTLCFNPTTRIVGSTIEGSRAGFTISLGR